MPRTFVFIDAGILRPNIISQRLSLGLKQRFDWIEFQKCLQRINPNIAEYHYFDSITDMDSQGLVHFHTFLVQELKFKLHLTHTSPVTRKCPICKNTHKAKEQKGVDVSLAIEAVERAKDYDEAFFITGDGDFIQLLKKLAINYQKQNTLLCWGQGTAEGLKRQCRHVLYLEHYAKYFITEKK